MESFLLNSNRDSLGSERIEQELKESKHWNIYIFNIWETVQKKSEENGATIICKTNTEHVAGEFDILLSWF